MSEYFIRTFRQEEELSKAFVRSDLYVPQIVSLILSAMDVYVIHQYK